ncbi:MAG: S46 family peptidase [Gemmatimonadota bacterium]|nr:MAG: S46 family peptidase [Gemmatimonadota bacterium]
MIRSARGWHVLALGLAVAWVASCSSRAPSTASEAPEPMAGAAAPQQLATAPALLGGVEAVEAAGLGKMWTFDRVPGDYLGERYDFSPPSDWYEHVRLASLRYGGGCSASFVSADGLVMTNHHCARGCITAVSTDEHDYDTDGFYAATREDEPVCQGLFLDQLVEIEDVTARVDAAAPAGSTREEETRLKREAMQAITEECSAGGLRCQVVSLYNGGIYSLYKYRRYDDVRLVFAPEGQAAFFGGDPDNFTYPRHDLDVTFVRAYENGEPLQPEHYFKWSESGAGADELVFVTGNPGTTLRLQTLAQLGYMRDATHPTIIKQYKERVAAARKLVEADRSLEPRYRNLIFGIENATKAYNGYLSGLEDPELMAAKAAWEESFRAAVAADPGLQSRYGDAWDEIARVNAELKAMDAEVRWTSLSHFALLSRARDIVRLAEELSKPESERTYSAAELERMERRVGADRTVDVAYEQLLLSMRLADAREVLGPDHPFIQAALEGREPGEAAAFIYQTSELAGIYQDSTLAGVEARRKLTEADAAAIGAPRDPAIALARSIDARARQLERRQEELETIETANEERIAEALFEIYGTALPPDATFTLRLADGVVKGYPLNGTYAPYKTTFYGLYDRAAAFDYQEPWHLTEKWKAAKNDLDLSTPLNFVCTADIIGGNSGSPVINRDAEVVGLVFDGNIEMLPNRFRYSDAVARTVAVHSEAILEALRVVYDAGTLADELEGKR